MTAISILNFLFFNFVKNKPEENYRVCVCAQL